jgi:NADPH2:quinone reductase
VLLNNRSVVGVDWGAWAMRHPGEQATLLDEVLAKVGARTLHPVAPTTRPLADAGDVLRDLLERRLQGKTVLIP